MTSVSSTGLNSYAQYGSAYARAAATQPSLAGTLATGADDPFSANANAATNLTLSDAARAQLASVAAQKPIGAVVSEMRATLDGLYAAAKVTGPLGSDGKSAVDLSKLDRRALHAVATNNGGRFTADEQSVAASELTKRFNAALAPSTATAQLTGDFSGIYQAAQSYLDAAGPEEKATALWSAQHDAVLKGVQATQRDPTKAPANIANDPVAAYLAQPAYSSTTADFGSVAKAARAVLDAQANAAAAAGKELVFDPGRKIGQLAELSSLDNRALSAISLNQDALFDKQEGFAAKKELDARNRASILEALKKSQSSGDPTQLSLGILNTYSAMSAEERQAANWTPAFRDSAVQSYKSTSNLLSMLKGG